jgi:ribosomal protein S19E (S16A)
MTDSAPARLSRNDLHRRQSLASGIDLDDVGYAELRRIAANPRHTSNAPHAINDLDRLGLIRRIQHGYALTPRGQAILDEHDAARRKAPSRRRS